MAYIVGVTDFQSVLTSGVETASKAVPKIQRTLPFPLVHLAIGWGGQITCPIQAATMGWTKETLAVKVKDTMETSGGLERQC